MTNRAYNVLIVVLVALLVFGCGTSRKGQTKKKGDKKEPVIEVVDTTKLTDPLTPVEPQDTVGLELIEDTDEPLSEVADTTELVEPAIDPGTERDTTIIEPAPIPTDTIKEDTKLPKIPSDSTSQAPKDTVDIKLQAEKEAIAKAQSEAEAKRRAVFDEPQKPEKKSSSSGPESKLINFTADIMRPIQIAEDSTAINLLHNVVLYHNGAVITCDSAVRYSAERMDCFKRVVINQGTTYAYGDKLVYNGALNEARVYAPIIKMVDKDAVLLTYKFTFNTKDKVGIYDGGGTMTQKENQMESQRGYYYVDTREVVGVDQVELRNPEYSMKSDSVIYNLDTEAASFYTTSHVWNDKKDMLVADIGRYNHATADYVFTKNSYVLTADQEVWSDTLVYNSRTENATLYRDIQIRDEEQNTIAFGDYGEYWGEREEAMLTLDPSLLSYDPQEPDTLYMRSDSMFLYTFAYDTTLYTPAARGPAGPAKEGKGERVGAPREGSEGLKGLEGSEGLEELEGLDGELADSLSDRSDRGRGQRQPKLDSLGMEIEREFMVPDSLANGAVDSLGVEQIKEDDKKSIKKKQKEEKDKNRRLKAKARSAKLAAQNAAWDAKIAAQIAKREAEIAAKKEAKKAKRKLKKSKRGEESDDDEIQLAEELDSVLIVSEDGALPDSLLNVVTDSLAMENGGGGVEGDLAEESSEPQYDENGELIVVDLPDPEVESDPDKKQRMIRAYHNVRVFRTDFQAVCDSLVGFSKDSTMHLYIEPIMWSDNNQVTSEVMDIFIRNGEIYKVEFVGGNPFMVSEVDTTRYNQIKGKYMEAWFRNNDLFKHDVIGNGQMLYYMQDEETQDLLYFMAMECADITFLIDNKQVDKISWKGSPDYTIYPMDKIADDQEQFLPDFVWHDSLRPKGKEEILTRIIRPSLREQMRQMDEPLFPLTQNIESDRERMILHGIWRDRNDELSPLALEYIQSIKLELEEVVVPTSTPVPSGTPN